MSYLKDTNSLIYLASEVNLLQKYDLSDPYACWEKKHMIV